MIPDRLEPEANISRWNLTWSLKHYEGNVMQIQLYFNDPTAIS